MVNFHNAYFFVLLRRDEYIFQQYSQHAHVVHVCISKKANKFVFAIRQHKWRRHGKHTIYSRVSWKDGRVEVFKIQGNSTRKFLPVFSKNR